MKKLTFLMALPLMFLCMGCGSEEAYVPEGVEEPMPMDADSSLDSDPPAPLERK